MTSLASFDSSGQHSAVVHHVQSDERFGHHDCSLDFLGQMFFDEKPFGTHVVYPSSYTVRSAPNTITDNEEFLVDPLVFLMEQDMEPEGIVQCAQNTESEYSSSYDPATAVTVSLGDDDVLSEEGNSDFWRFETNSISPEPTKILFSIDETVSPIPLSSELRNGDNSFTCFDLQLNQPNHTTFFMNNTVTTPAHIPSASLPASDSFSSTSVSSVLKEPTLQQQVDEAIREFKERQKIRELIDLPCFAQLNGKRPSSGQSLEQEARDAMRQYWKRRKRENTTYSSEFMPLASPSTNVGIPNISPYAQVYVYR